MMKSVASRFRSADLVLLLGRLLLALIFLHEGSSLAADLASTIDTFANLGLSAPIALATIALQIGAGISVAAGFLGRLGATALALFCLATALLFHTNFTSQNEFLHFEKDLAIAGGMFVLAASGAGSISVDNLLKRRTTGNHPWLRAMM
ncbi:DoxX family protein [Rhizobium sp. CBN3]|uniref:DoxX family protein n=1 Tax=Rhizobium sp. CBN3 TaxID=3058045 RepID=UPI002671A1A1|nr:DoxX family protein [Rhizobium sp. CBN3]MDO3433203.1 DoxX family protein [Rhizobium sp. CBN3]